ncbi:phosphotransferase family protein [Meiothermus granaticius]|uniref:Thiamine kinase n=1 Tax=Meiothermus granaticius NBRC 107808 TaxID=1227551 RepID=A0A399F9D0_9DEIN|nr:phosphotransferase family protein [Meiothermus granaticius]RIH92848.1 thiamine kinase [Meiothermus granaticius NBRC 107808]GEM85562.1 phosphotransferase family protein [Meiothermus granaticius NBRC 107808]
MLDGAVAVRKGEELNLEALRVYLSQHLPGGSGELEVLQFPGGFSNLTYLLRLDQQELVLRRPPLGASVKTAHDMAREYRILRALKPVYPKVPQALLYCSDEGVLGAPFYVMERLHGAILRNQATPELTSSRMHQVAQAALDALVELHHLDYRQAGLSDLGHPEGYVERQVRGWTERYLKARTETVEGLERAMAWLPAHLPPSGEATLLHNDFKYDNLLFSPDLQRVEAVLDWEMATLGDPLMDLGTTLAYWAEAGDPPSLQRFGLTHLLGNFSRAELIQAYAERTGREASRILFYYVFGLFKVGGIMQQIYARYRMGLTQDPRFGELIHPIRAIGERLEKALDSGEV